MCEEYDDGPVTMCCIYVQLVDEWLTAMLVESLLSYILYAGCHFGAKNWVRLLAREYSSVTTAKLHTQPFGKQKLN